MSILRKYSLAEPLHSWPLESASDTVLYDMFYESGTILNAYLLKLEESAANDDEAQRFREESFQLLDEREATQPHDRSEQITLKNKWDLRVSQLEYSYSSLLK